MAAHGLDPTQAKQIKMRERSIYDLKQIQRPGGNLLPVNCSIDSIRVPLIELVTKYMQAVQLQDFPEVHAHVYL